MLENNAHFLIMILFFEGGSGPRIKFRAFDVQGMYSMLSRFPGHDIKFPPTVRSP